MHQGGFVIITDLYFKNWVIKIIYSSKVTQSQLTKITFTYSGEQTQTTEQMIFISSTQVRRKILIVLLGTFKWTKISKSEGKPPVARSGA